MTDIITYLKDYREEEPEWTAKYLRGEQITTDFALEIDNYTQK